MQEAHQGPDHLVDLQQSRGLASAHVLAPSPPPPWPKRHTAPLPQASPALLTRSPGKAIPGAVVMVILARACAALVCPASVPSRAKGIRA